MKSRSLNTRQTILGLLQMGALLGLAAFFVLIGGLMWPGSPLWADPLATPTPSSTPTTWGSGGPTVTPPWTPTPTASPSLTSTPRPGLAYLPLMQKDPNPTATDTPLPTATPTHTPTMMPPEELDLIVSWNSPIEPPQQVFTITIELVDAGVGYADWVLEDVLGNIAQGRLYSGQSTAVQLAIDWATLPLGRSSRLFYVFGKGDDGSTFAQAVVVYFDRPITTVTPTPTMSCGYARFVLRSPAELSIEYPTDSFDVEIANEGILSCGNLDWWIVAPTIQSDILSCSPSGGLLESGTLVQISCWIDWNNVPPGQIKDYFLVLFSYPQVNGEDSVHLVRIRVTRPM